MKTKQREELHIIGFATRTINAPLKAEIDIPALWNKFMIEQTAQHLPEKLSDETYCVYCEYEGDHTQPYTTLIGYPMPENAVVPEGMKSVKIPASSYGVFKAEGDLTTTAVINTWYTIWESKMNRTFKADFEVYGKEAANPKDGKVDIFVGIEA